VVSSYSQLTPEGLPNRDLGARGDEKIRCVVAHDHALFRQGLRRLLEDEPDLEVVAEAGMAAAALRAVCEHRPDVVITDAELFGCAEKQAEGMILRESAEARVLFVGTGHHEGRVNSAKDLVQLVRGRALTLLPAPLKRRVDEMHPRRQVLTAREREVLKLLAEGKTVRAAAGLLGVSIKTVDAHKFNLMRKLGIHNKAELVMWAVQKEVVKVTVGS